MMKIKSREKEMASLAEIGIPGVGSGILHPTMKNRFRFKLTGERYNLITMQTTSVSLNMVTQTVVLTVEQPATHAQDMLDMIQDLAGSKFTTSFSIDLMDGNDTAYGQITGFLHIIDHALEFDYASNGTAEHVITFKYIRSA